VPIPTSYKSVKATEDYKNALVGTRSNVENFVLCDITRDSFESKLIDPASLKYLKVKEEHSDNIDIITPNPVLYLIA
jgi:hypothetical protein